MIYLPILLIIAFCIFFSFFQEQFIFLNGKKLSKDYLYKFTNPFEELFIKSIDDTLINAVHFQLKNPKGIILFCHGNKGNLTKWGNRVSYLLNYNYEVLLFDYRNYGKSTGGFNEQKMYEDALQVYQHINTMYSEDEIVVYGYSIGCTFATKIAQKNTPKHLILEAPFYSLKKAVQNALFLAPTFLLKYKFSTYTFFNLVKVPITIFHGKKDSVTPLKGSKKLFQLNNNPANDFITLEEATHHNIRTFNLYKQKLEEIL
ncbi:alpha/beta hydrolase [Polaribacter sp.]|uniref:alpha/beta hydrolase n=1 Tax=Polaribacter sp. TaxID=1920175 RepID=UPI003F6D82D3